MNRTQTALLALLLGLLSMAPAGAQGPPVGATWWRFFVGGDPDSPSGYGIGDLVFMEAVRDSSVSATMRMVEVEFSISRIQPPNQIDLAPWHLESQFWYYTSDSVFVYGKNNNVLTLLHTFNWPENSTQNIAPNTSLLYFAESGIQYDVHIQDSITIKSKQVKRTVGNESSFFLVRYQSEFFEIIGSNGAPYPIADYVSIFGQFSGLVCYEDSIFGAVTFGDTICECDCKTHVDSLLLRRTVGISEATKTTQQLHFDRAASQLHFMGAFPAEITDVVVYNALGQAVQRWRVHDTPTLDVSQLPQGVYWAVANGQWYKFLKQ